MAPELNDPADAGGDMAPELNEPAAAGADVASEDDESAEARNYFTEDENIKEEVLIGVRESVKAHLTSLRCSICKNPFSMNRLPRTCECKTSFCSKCFRKLPNMTCSSCSKDLSNVLADKEIPAANESELFCLDDPAKSLESSETIMEALNAMGRDLQSHYESRLYYFNFMDNHTKKLENICNEFSEKITNFYDCCKILATVDEANVLNKIEEASKKLVGIEDSVSKVNCALIRTCQLNRDEKHLRIFLNLRTLRFDVGLMKALKETKRSIWILASELGEKYQMYFRLQLQVEGKLHQSAIRKDLQETLDPVFVTLKCFLDQKFFCSGFFMKFKIYGSRLPDKKEISLFFDFNMQKSRNVSFNRQVELLLTGERFRCYKGVKCSAKYSANNIVACREKCRIGCVCNRHELIIDRHNPVMKLDPEIPPSGRRKLAIDGTDDIFDGIPDVTILQEKPKRGDVIAYRKDWMFTKLCIQLRDIPVEEMFNFCLVGTIKSSSRQALDEFIEVTTGVPCNIVVKDCGCIYDLPASIKLT